MWLFNAYPFGDTLQSPDLGLTCPIPHVAP